MDFQPTPSDSPGPLIATLHNATIDKPEGNEFFIGFISRSYTNTIEYDLCVSLEKFSDPSNVLEESSHPPQATGTPALQGPLTPPEDDYVPVPTTISIILPRELVERIFLLLDTKSILKCRFINREFNAIIQSSISVQYYLACNAAGVIDNPQSPLSYAERLEVLKKREDAWKKLEPVFETTIEIIDRPSWWRYKLTAGKCFLNNGKDLYYCPLPSAPQDNSQWFRIPGHGPEQNLSGSIVESSMAVYEHDLVVNVISSEVGNQADMQPQYSLDLVLLKLSTGEYHPLARQPLFCVQRSSPLVRPNGTASVVGDNLALVVNDYNGSRLFIFDWKSGHKRLHKANEKAYAGSRPVFVSPELLLVPNRTLCHFEVWHLSPPHPNPPFQILSLQVPAVSDNYSIIEMHCHGEVNPFLHSMPYFPPRPFLLSSEDSIITVNIRLQYVLGGRGSSTYKFIIQRHALLDMIQKWTAPSLLEQQCLPTWLTNEVTVHKVADQDDGSVRLGAQSELVSGMSHLQSSTRTHDSPTLVTSQVPASHTSNDFSYSSISSASASTSRYNIPQVQWADWGPPISRWFPVYGNNRWHWWNNQSTGQKYVFLEPNPRDGRKRMVSVADFNVQNVRRNAETLAQLRGEGKDNSGNEEELEILDHDGEFSEEVYMGLKCVVNHAPGEYDFDGVMMDEERLLGLKLDSENRVGSIKVLYFG